MPHTILELFEAWQGKFVQHRHIDVWRLVPHCLIWCIWRKGMLEVLRVVNALCWRLSLSSYTLSLNGVWFFLIFLVLPFLCFLTVVLLFPELCPHSTSPMYSVWQSFYY